MVIMRADSTGLYTTPTMKRLPFLQDDRTYAQRFRLYLPPTCGFPDSSVRVVPLNILSEHDVEWFQESIDLLPGNVSCGNLHHIGLSARHTNGTVDLLQLATKTRILLVEIDSESPVPREARALARIKPLVQILQDPDIAKTGMELAILAVYIYDTLGFKLNGGYDLSVTYNKDEGAFCKKGLSAIFHQLYPDASPIVSERKARNVDSNDDAGDQNTVQDIRFLHSTLEALMCFWSGRKEPDKVFLGQPPVMASTVPDWALRMAPDVAAVLYNRDKDEFINEFRSIEDFRNETLPAGGRNKKRKRNRGDRFDRSDPLHKNVVTNERFNNRIRKRNKVMINLKHGENIPALSVHVRGRRSVLRSDRFLKGLRPEHVDQIVVDQSDDFSNEEESLSRYLGNVFTGSLDNVDDDAVFTRADRMVESDDEGDGGGGRAKSAGNTPYFIRGLFDPEFDLKGAASGSLVVVTDALRQAVDEHLKEGHLNPAQMKAARTILLGSDPVVVVKGPPGTGKTTVISQSIKTWFKYLSHSNDTIVCAAKGNVAVRNIATSMLKNGFEDFRLIVSNEYFEEWHEDQYTSRSLRSKVISSNLLMHPVIAFELRTIPVILCTLGMLSTTPHLAGSFLSSHNITTLILDEASQTHLGSLIVPLHRLRATLRKVVFFGDNEQLPPYGASAVRTKDMKSVFDLPRFCADAVFLNEQYRMPVVLAEFLSDYVYGGELVSASSGGTRAPETNGMNETSDFEDGQPRETGPPPTSLAESPLLWVDAPGRETPHGTSFTNEYEVNTVIPIVSYLIQTRSVSPSDIAILTGYDAQRNLLSKRLRELNLDGSSQPSRGRSYIPRWGRSTSRRRRRTTNRNRPGTGGGLTPADSEWESDDDDESTETPLHDRVFNVDSFQGQEASYVIVSLVRTARVGFLRDKRRTTVMLSRMKKQLIVVGDVAFFRSVGYVPRSATVTEEVLESGERVINKGGQYKSWTTAAENRPLVTHMANVCHRMNLVVGLREFLSGVGVWQGFPPVFDGGVPVVMEMGMWNGFIPMGMWYPPFPPLSNPLQIEPQPLLNHLDDTYTPNPVLDRNPHLRVRPRISPNRTRRSTSSTNRRSTQWSRPSSSSTSASAETTNVVHNTRQHLTHPLPSKPSKQRLVVTIINHLAPPDSDEEQEQNIEENGDEENGVGSSSG
ncbi:hypothetical protein HK102_009838, partial [Quaeritorhiza haematococci]